MAMADFQSGVANVFQYINPINWIKPRQSREGMLLEYYVKQGNIRPEKVGELFSKQKSGLSSAQILQEITAAPDQYFVKTEEERQIAVQKAKVLIEQQAEKRRQGQSRQIGGVMEQFRQPPAQMPQGLSQMPGQQAGAMPGLPSMPQTIPQGGSEGLLPSSQFMSQLSSMPQFTPQMPSSQQERPGSNLQGGTPQGQALPPSQGQPSQLEAMIAMWNAGHGPTEPEQLTETILKLLPMLSPEQQEQAMRNQALQSLQPGSKEYQQEFLTKATPTAQQDVSNRFEQEKFVYQQKKDEQNRLSRIGLVNIKESGALKRLNIKLGTQREFMDAKNKFALTLAQIKTTGEDKDAQIAMANLIRMVAKDTAGPGNEVTEEHIAVAIDRLSKTMPDTFGAYAEHIENAEPGMLNKMTKGWLGTSGKKLKSFSVQTSTPITSQNSWQSYDK
jgi:hypothetical protein